MLAGSSMPRKLKDLDDPIVDPTNFSSMNKYNQPIHGDGYVLSLHESHPLVKPWAHIHPALELDIDMRLYKFISEMTPLMDEFWDHVRDQSIRKDILFRWHKRRLDLLLHEKNLREREDIFRDYITALLFERVYSRAIESRRTFHKIHEKEWLNTKEFNEFHRQCFLERLERDRQFVGKLAKNPFDLEIKKPNEDKTPDLDLKDRLRLDNERKEFNQLYRLARETSQMVFSQDLIHGLTQANQQLLQTPNIRQIFMILRSLNPQWASLFKEAQNVHQHFTPAIKNQTQLLAKVKGDNSSQGNIIPESQQFDGPTKEVIRSERFTVDVIKTIKDSGLVVKQQSRNMVIENYSRHHQVISTDNVQAAPRFSVYQDAKPSHPSTPQQQPDSHETKDFLREQSTYPRLMGEALQGEHSFDVPRSHWEKLVEQEQLNSDHLDVKTAKDKLLRDHSDKQILEDQQIKLNRILAGHDYGKQIMVEPHYRRPAPDTPPRPTQELSKAPDIPPSNKVKGQKS